MKRLLDWLLAGLVLLVGRRRSPGVPPPGSDGGGGQEEHRIVPSGPPSSGAETAVLLLLGGTSLTAMAFVVVYALDRIGHQTQLLGLTLGLAFLLLAAASLVTARHLVVTEENEEDYPELGHPEDEQAIAQIVDESGSRITRKRLLTVAACGTGGAIGLALVTPAASLGPFLDWEQLVRTPWRAGRRLVGENGRPLRASDVDEGVFYTAFPEGADRQDIAAPVVVVRLPVSALRLPSSRNGWAPTGILAYSKICTHAGCAISLYRSPLFAPAEPKPALVCPCHYSTFDPAGGGTVLFGPAGRPLPQLPLRIDSVGFLRAAGSLSGPVGPSWWSVRTRSPGS